MSRHIYAFVLILIISLPFFVKQACGQSTIFNNGAYRFVIVDDFNNFWASGTGQLINANEGKVFATDAMVGQAIWVNNAQDGETLTWEYIRPDSSVRTTATITYDLSTDCWIGGDWFPTCGDPDNPYYGDSIGWIQGISISNEMLGNWTINFLNNGVLLFSEQFELVGKEFKILSGDGQEGLPGETLLEPLVVSLQNTDDKQGVPGANVTFQITSQPNGARGTGLSEDYNVPPLGTETTSLTTTTDTFGIATVYLEMGNKEGVYIIIATASDADTGSPQTFTVSAKKLAIGDVEMRAYNDVDLPGIVANDPFFSAHFDIDGKLIVDKNNPIGEMVNDNFTLNIILNAFPNKPVWIPDTKWKWQISGLGAPTNGADFTNWETLEPITPVIKTPSHRDFGDHDMKLNFTFYDQYGARINTQAVKLKLKLFFDKYGDDNGNGDINWFEYWQRGKVVPGMEDFFYDPDDPTYGQFVYPGLFLGQRGAGLLEPIEINNIVFGGTEGLDTTASIVAHELFHQYVYNMTHGRGEWVGKQNSDKDALPDFYEFQIGTDPEVADTFELAINPDYLHFGDYLKDHGDEEYDALLHGLGGKGFAEKDWAYPGKQTDPSN